MESVLTIYNQNFLPVVLKKTHRDLNGYLNEINLSRTILVDEAGL